MRRLRYFIHRMFVTLSLSFVTVTVCAGGAIPVMVGGEVELDACGGIGEVQGLNPRSGDFLAVRMGPGSKYPIIDSLYNGNKVYFCDEHGEWVGIVYEKSMEDCGVSSPLLRRKPYIGPCRSGWAHRNWLVMSAG